MKTYVVNYIKENKKTLAILFLCLLVGLLVGIACYQLIDNDNKIQLANHLKETLDVTKQENFEGINIIKNGVTSNILLVLLLYLCAITLIAPFLISGVTVVKGFVIGLYIPTLFQVLGSGNGMLALLLLVIVPNLFFVPAYIYLCNNAIRFYYQLIELSSKAGLFSLIIKECYYFIISFSLILFSVVTEQVLSGIIIQIYKSIG